MVEGLEDCFGDYLSHNANYTIRRSNDGGAAEACLTGGDRHRKETIPYV